MSEKLIELCVAVIKTSRLKSNTAASLAAHIFIGALIWHHRAALWILDEPTRQLAESVLLPSLVPGLLSGSAASSVLQNSTVSGPASL